MDNRNHLSEIKQMLLEMVKTSTQTIQQKEGPRTNNKRTKKERNITTCQKIFDQKVEINFQDLPKDQKQPQSTQKKLNDIRKSPVLSSVLSSKYQSNYKNTSHLNEKIKKLQQLNQIVQFIKQLSVNKSQLVKKKCDQFLFDKQVLIEQYQSQKLKIKELSELQQKVKNKNVNEKIQQKQEQKQSEIQKKSQQKSQMEKIQNLKCRIQNKKDEIKSLKAEFQKAKIQMFQPQLQRGQIQRQIQTIQNKTNEINQKREQIKRENQVKSHQLSKLKQEYQLRFEDDSITTLLMKLPLDYLDKKQRRLNGELQQMRGNIRVYCRIRPICKDQKPMNYELKQHDLLNIKKDAKNLKSLSHQSDYTFELDRIFKESAKQEQVFGEISQLVQSAMDGFNVSIFAYGQTGSGKTFTMQGKKQPKQAAGVIPRSIKLIFHQIQKNKKAKTTTSIAISLSEIYNNKLVNLLTKSNVSNGKPIFKNISSMEQVQDSFHKAVSNRSTAFTQLNSDSSRSHLIFIIRFSQKKLQMVNGKERQNITQGNLLLIDLAGSQNPQKSKVEGQRLEEAKKINTSLLYLGKLLNQMRQKNKPSSFRNCQLTHFFQPYLQKGSKAVMFVNISSSVQDESQTINSLNFAKSIRNISLKK